MDNNFDVAIIGGGVAGLCLSIRLAQLNKKVILFEKNEYPFHKVCGEYISMESWQYLERLGLPLSQMNLPIINQLSVTSTKGYKLDTKLSLGGFGISRYTLDFELAKLAKKNGVVLFENCKVLEIETINIDNKILTSIGIFYSKIVCGSYGRFTPSFLPKIKSNLTPAYIGIKYHIKTNFESDKIALHTFKNGYCGISKVDKETYCLCYLTTAKNLKLHNNNIEQMEKEVLMKNPYLASIFNNSEFLFEKPLAISQITFKAKSTFSKGVFLLGDAAGAIAPLCGNGMSMGVRASAILSQLLDDYLEQKISLETLKLNYQKQWNKLFKTRINTGYYLQQILGNNTATHFTLKILKILPIFFQKLISLTHGKPY